MFKLKKEHFFELLILISFIFILGSVLYASAHWMDEDPMTNWKDRYMCTWGEYKEIKSAARKELKPRASKACGKYAEINVANVFQGYALIHLRPDMEKCITDPAWMVLKKEGKDWKFVVMGTAIFDVEFPRKLIDEIF